jgi:hypothetical protein
MAALLIVALAGVMFVACGGGDDDNNDDNDNGDNTPAATRTSGDNGNATPDDGDDGGNGGSTGELQDYVDKFVDSTFSANYHVVSAGTDESIGDLTEVRITKDGKDKFRFDAKGTSEGEEIEIIVIDAGDVQGFCAKGSFAEVFGGSGDGVCFDDPPGGAGSPTFTEEFENFSADDLELIDTTEREIAGQDAKCFKTRDKTTDDTSTICLNDDGHMLAFSDEADGSSFDATDVSGDVSGDAFDLPYEVRDFPDLGQ